MERLFKLSVFVPVLVVSLITTAFAGGTAGSAPATTGSYNVDQSNVKKMMDRYVNKAYTRGFFNGCILLAQGDKILYENAMGVADMETGRKLDIGTVCELASVSKQFTAEAIMMLHDRGQLSLSDKLEKYFPGTPYKGITIQNLLNHTSGLPDYSDWVVQKASERGGIPNNTIMDEFVVKSGTPALFAPNAEWSYCNTGYALLARIVEKVTGRSYGEFLEKKIFEPAGMDKTCVYHRHLDGDKIQNYAYGYVLDNGQYILPDNSKNNNFVIVVDGIEGDGCVNSNVYDLLKWSLALQQYKFLSQKSQEEMYKPTRYGHGEECSYGYGWVIGNDVQMGRILTHSGGWPGYSTRIFRYTDKDLTLIYLMNKDPLDAWGRATFEEGLQDIVKGQTPRPIKTFDELVDHNDLDTSKYPAFCGKYENDNEIILKDGKLYVAGREFGETEELFPSIEGGFITEEGCSITLDGQKMIVSWRSLTPSIYNKLD
ncbi:Penicillin-binding protein 4* [Sporomusa rhizae]|uniref:serine hydrolase domain-containing protein n=1 Tax=Sporomusa rhizae TaxID=357999 RepID=UPI00352A7C88